MKAEDILTKDDFQKCVDFHGHQCPGLSMGYRASLAGMEWLRANRASDEEIVAKEVLKFWKCQLKISSMLRKYK